MTIPPPPDRKVGAGALAGALSAIVVWVIGDVPAEVAVAFATVLHFGVSYFVRD